MLYFEAKKTQGIFLQYRVNRENFFLVGMWQPSVFFFTELVLVYLFCSQRQISGSSVFVLFTETDLWFQCTYFVHRDRPLVLVYLFCSQRPLALLYMFCSQRQTSGSSVLVLFTETDLWF